MHAAKESTQKDCHHHVLLHAQIKWVLSRIEERKKKNKSRATTLPHNQTEK